MTKRLYVRAVVCAGLLILMIPWQAQAKRRYRLYIDASRAEEIFAGITLKKPLEDDKWLTLLGDRRDDIYTVVEGDTLWDISHKEFKDPYLWRKLWQTNPAITNPHEIT